MGEDSRIWTDIRSLLTDSGATYTGETSGSTAVEVTISEGACGDSMSGAFFGHRATVVAAGETLGGCALRGAAELIQFVPHD